MRTDEEIKKFIDSKEALTQRELNEFIYGHARANGKLRTTGSKWFQYVLETKDWEVLRKHRENRINKGKGFKMFKELYDKDVRLRTRGNSTQLKVLKDIYGISLSKSTLSKYNTIICLQKTD